MNNILRTAINIIRKNISNIFIFWWRILLIIGSFGLALFVGVYIDPLFWTRKFVIDMDPFIWLKLLLYFFIILFASVLFIFAGVGLITNKKRLPSVLGSLIFLDIIYVTIYFIPTGRIYSFISKDFSINLNLVYWLISFVFILSFYMMVYMNRKLFVK